MAWWRVLRHEARKKIVRCSEEVIVSHEEQLQLSVSLSYPHLVRGILAAPNMWVQCGANQPPNHQVNGRHNGNQLSGNQVNLGIKITMSSLSSRWFASPLHKLVFTFHTLCLCSCSCNQLTCSLLVTFLLVQHRSSSLAWLIWLW